MSAPRRSDQIPGDFFEHLQVAGVLGGCRCQVIVVEVETGAQGVFTHSRRRDITFGAHHGAQRLAVRCLWQAGDLSAYAFERQLAAVRETLDLGSAGQYHDRCIGQQVFAIPGLPVSIHSTQFQYIVMGHYLDVRMRCLPLAQRRRMHPSTFGVKQATPLQADTGTRLGLFSIECLQQVFGKRLRQLRLTLGFLGIEGQLQHTAIVPVDAPLQLFKQAPGVTETADNQLRQRRAVGRQA